MIANENNLLAPEDKRNETLWFSRLSAFVDEDSAKLELGEAWIASSNTGSADDIGIGKNLSLSGSSESLELLLILAGEFAEFGFELHEFRKLRVCIVHTDLTMECEEADA